MENTRKFLLWCLYILTGALLVNFIALIITCCIIKETKTSSSMVEEINVIKTIDYTNCSNLNGDGRCRDIVKYEECECLEEKFNLTEDLFGDNVWIYYELPSFNDTEIAKDPNFFKSRDNNQLAGNLAVQVSPDCGNFSYDVTGKPIAPCGALAHYMFNDRIKIYRVLNGSSDSVPVPTLNYGIIPESDKVGFKNPRPKDTDVPGYLANVFKNFSTPNTWNKKLWELDVDDSENNGFQNERFIGWMRPDLTLKPLARLDKSKREYSRGLKRGTYSVQATFYYSPSIYNGTRRVVLVVGGTRLKTSTESFTSSSRIWLLVMVLLSMFSMGSAFKLTLNLYRSLGDANPFTNHAEKEIETINIDHQHEEVSTKRQKNPKHFVIESNDSVQNERVTNLTEFEHPHGKSQATEYDNKKCGPVNVQGLTLVEVGMCEPLTKRTVLDNEPFEETKRLSMATDIENQVCESDETKRLTKLMEFENKTYEPVEFNP